MGASPLPLLFPSSVSAAVDLLNGSPGSPPNAGRHGRYGDDAASSRRRSRSSHGVAARARSLVAHNRFGIVLGTGLLHGHSTSAAMMPVNISIPLPSLPEPPIYDAPYDPKLMEVLDDASYPPGTSAEQIYATQLGAIQAVLRSRDASSRSMSIALLAAWASMVIMCGYLLARVRRNRQRALRGDADAARKIVLPSFEPLLWLLGGLNLSLMVLYSGLLVTHDFVVYHSRLAMEAAAGVKQLNGLVVITYMLQPSLSRLALLRAFWLALLLSFYTVPIVAILNEVATRDNQPLCYWTLIGSRSLIAVYLLSLVVFPPARASVSSFRLLCLYVLGMVMLIYAMCETYHHKLARVANVIGWTIGGYSVILPLCVWYVLRADTEHWRGMGKRAVELQETFRRKNGKIQERVSSEGLHVLIEMHRKLIIDFARLQFQEMIREATGGDTNSAMIYRGFLHTKKVPVAIKVYMPDELTEATVAEFSHEAALCGSLIHPNIVHFHGLCVCPPNICLVTELCQISLMDMVKTRPRHSRKKRQAEPACRAQMLVNVGYMIDAARALAYLHSFSPAFVHRDIKPGSFLIDTNGTVKLTDFGASCVLSVQSTSNHQRCSVSNRPDHAGTVSMYSLDAEAARVSSPSRLAHDVRACHTAIAAQYVAPELIQGYSARSSIYGEAADVFSLAITMWDVLHPRGLKYPLASAAKSTTSFGSADRAHQRDQIFELVAAGHRPPLDPNLPVALRELLQVAWHANPRMRPSAQAMVASLETIQEGVCSAFAQEIMAVIMSDRIVQPMPKVIIPQDQQTSFAGSLAVRKLRSSKFVSTESHATRLGNMLMDCGFLHHTSHARSFECSSSHYVFDVDKIVSRQSLALLEAGHRISDSSRVDDGTFASRTLKQMGQDGRASLEWCTRELGSSGGDPWDPRSASSYVFNESGCACRKLGQRIISAPVTRGRFRPKFKAFTHENLLTARLLDNGNHQPGSEDFAFHESPALMRRRDAPRSRRAMCLG